MIVIGDKKLYHSISKQKHKRKDQSNIRDYTHTATIKCKEDINRKRARKININKIPLCIYFNFFQVGYM